MFSLLKDWYHTYPLYISSQRRYTYYRPSPYWKSHNSARMKTILACLLVLAISVPLSNAYCFFQSLKTDMSDGEHAGCYDSKGHLHEFSSHWRTDDCHDCSCSRDGINCCSSFTRPAGYNEEKCVSIFNKETCTYKVVEKDDHSKECPVYIWVG